MFVYCWCFALSCCLGDLLMLFALLIVWLCFVILFVCFGLLFVVVFVYVDWFLLWVCICWYLFCLLLGGLPEFVVWLLVGLFVVGFAWGFFWFLVSVVALFMFLFCFVTCV